MRITDALTDFLEAKRAGNRSEKTLEKYQNIIEQLVEQTGDLHLEDLPPRSVRAFLADCRRRGLAPATLLTYYTSLRTFVRWSCYEYRIEHDPMRNVDRPRVPERLPPYLNKREQAALIRATQRSRVAAKHEALIRVLLATGIRAGELCSLRRDEVDLERGEIRVLGKDQKERTVPLARSAARALLHYWKGRIDAIPTAFHGLDSPLTVAGLRTTTRRLGERAGISKTVHPHLLRHTFAHRWLVGGGDLESLRRLLGHSSIQTTQRYAGMSIDDIKAKYQEIIR
jgi:site-specific recombinase XerD